MPLTDRMPTMAKAAAAITMAAVAWLASEEIKPLLPDDTQFGWFNIVNALLGVICGWVVVGTRVGRGYWDGISAGLTGVVALVFWGVFAQSFNQMLKNALDRRYDGFFEGISSVFEIAFDFSQYLWHLPLIILLVIGGILVGFIAEWVSHRWS